MEHIETPQPVSPPSPEAPKSIVPKPDIAIPVITPRDMVSSLAGESLMTEATVEYRFDTLAKALSEETQSMKPMGEPLLMRRELRPAGELVDNVRDRLMDYAAATDDAGRDGASALVLSDFRELHWRGEMPALVTELAPKERDLLLSLSRQATIATFSHVLSGDIPLSDSIRRTKEDWAVHGSFVGTTAEYDYATTHGSVTENELKNVKDKASKIELAAISTSALADSARMHPEWVNVMGEAFIKHILPLITRP